MKRPILVILLLLLLPIVNIKPAMAFQSNSSAIPQQSSTLKPQEEKIRKQVDKIGLGKDVTVVLTDERELYGSVKSIETSGFIIYEVDTKQLLIVRYDEVKKVRKGYGHKKDATGKRVSSNKALIGTLIATAAILVPVIIVVASMSRER